MEYVTYEEFKKMDIRIGTIREIEAIEGTDKLLRCQVDFGIKKSAPSAASEKDSVLTDEELAKLGNVDDVAEASEERDIRQIISGIREYYPNYEELIGKQVLYIVNLEPRTIRGHQSNGMLMAVGDDKCVFLVPDEPVEPGSKVR